MKATKNELEFKKKVEAVVNEFCMENGSDTPDFMLADYLLGCLQNFNRTLRHRTKWYGMKMTFPEEGAVDPEVSKVADKLQEVAQDLDKVVLSKNEIDIDMTLQPTLQLWNSLRSITTPSLGYADFKTSLEKSGFTIIETPKTKHD